MQLSAEQACKKKKKKTSIWEADIRATVALMDQGSHACKTKHLRAMMIVGIAPATAATLFTVTLLYAEISGWRFCCAKHLLHQQQKLESFLASLSLPPLALINFLGTCTV